MIRLAITLLAGCVLLAGCGGTGSQQAPFEGHWRKFDDPAGKFVEFKGGKITLGDKSNSRTGTYTFQDIGEGEPLYGVQADLPDGKQEFQLYYESDTINLIGVTDEIDGLYEIIVELVPIER